MLLKPPAFWTVWRRERRFVDPMRRSDEAQ
jgi:hypothetical protein